MLCGSGGTHVSIHRMSLVLTGCAIDGLYTGECTLESGDKFIYEVEVDIDQDGEDLGGDALVLYPRDGSYGQGLH